MTPSKAETILPERAPHLYVPLRFFLLGILFLLWLLLAIVDRAPLLATDYLHNVATLAVTHLFTLGFAGSIVYAAVYQMVPVLLHSHLYSERLVGLHLVLHAAGVAAMVSGLSRFETAWTVAGGALVLTGGLLFLYNIVRTKLRAERWNWHGLFMAGAILFYMATLIWGLLLALNQRYGFWGEVEGPLLYAHLVLGLVGWFGLMIVGVGQKLVPMFGPARPLPHPLVAAVGGAVAGGVLLAVVGLLAHPALLAVGLGLVAAGLLGYTGGVLFTLHRRRNSPMDFSVCFAATAAVLLPLPVVGLLPAGRVTQYGLVFWYAMAFIGGTILGMLLRILPFMVWLHRFRNRTHKLERIPFLHEMFHPRLGWATYLGWFPAVAITAAGLALGSPLVVRAGGLLALGAVIPFVVAIGQVLYHIPPGRAPLYRKVRGEAGART